MNAKRNQPRRRPLFRIEVEGLESRQLLTGGAGNTFALETGTISTAGGTASIPFTLDSTHFSKPKAGRLEIGFDIVNNNSSSLDPVVVSVTKAGGGLVANNANLKETEKLEAASSTKGDSSKAMIISVPVPKGGKTASYNLNVKGLDGTSGDYLTGFYLVGDADGDGVVTKTDLATIKSEIGKTVTDSAYTFDADENRDGQITEADYMLAKKNLGAATTITPDLTANLSASSDTSGGNRITNVQDVNFTGVVAPGAAITYHEINNLTPNATATAGSTGSYSVMVPLGTGTNTFQVTASDAFGQTIQGDIQPVTYTTGPVTPASATTTTTTATT